MTVRVTIRGKEGLQKKIAEYAKKAPRRLDQVLTKAAFNTHNFAVTAIQQGAKSGREYRRGNKTHIASAPGQAPATDTGNLVQNITVKKEGPLRYSVGSRKDAFYGFWLEFGTSDMAPRPWLQPAYDQAVILLKRDLRGV